MPRIILTKTSTTATRQSIDNYIARHLGGPPEGGSRPSGVATELAAARSPVPKGVSAEMSETLRQGAEYFSRVEKPRMHAFGFIAGLMQFHAGRRLDELTDAGRAAAAREVWASAQGPRQKTAHNLVFRLTPDFARELMGVKVPPEAELLRVVTTSLVRFQKAFYPNDRLGYLIGMHHDHEHLRAHVLLFPRTEKGIEINMTHSRPVPDRFGGARRFQCQRFIKQQIDDLARSLHSSRVAQRSRMEPSGVAEAQSRLLSQYAADLANHEVTEERGRGQQLTEADAWSRALEKRATLLRSGGAAIRDALDKAYEQRLMNFNKMTKAQAGREIKETIEAIKRVRASLRKALGQGNAWEGARGVWKARHQLVRDVRTFKAMVYRWGRRICGEPNFRTWSEREWFERRAQAGDDLGRFMRETHDELRRSLMQREIISYTGTQARHATRWIGRTLAETKLSQLQHIQNAMRERLKDHQATVVKARAHEDLRARQCRIMLHHLEIDLADQRAAMAGRKPTYLQDYEQWRHGLETPVALVELGLLDAAEYLETEGAAVWKRNQVAPIEPPPPDPDPIKETAQPEQPTSNADLAWTVAERIRAIVRADAKAVAQAMRAPYSRHVPRNPAPPTLVNAVDQLADLAM